VDHDPRGTLRCSECLAEPSRAAVPLGLLPRSGSRGVQGNHDHDSEPSGRRTAEVAGVEAIMTTIFEPTGRHTYGMCGTFHFCAAIPLGRILCNGCHGPRGNHDHDFELSGRCTTEVAGVEAVVTTIPEPTGLRTYGMCRMFHFCVAVSPLLSPALTDARDLGALVSAWVWLARGAGTKRRAQWAAASRGG
jgi:hypothetical protein